MTPTRVGRVRQLGHRRDVVPQGQPSPRHRLRHGHGRPRPSRRDRHGQRQQRQGLAGAGPSGRRPPVAGRHQGGRHRPGRVASGPACPPIWTTPAGSPIRSMSCGSPTAAWTQVRRRVQNETLGHRGRKGDPLYRIRKMLLTGNERLDDRGRHRMLLGLRVGDPNDEVARRLAGQGVRPRHLPRRHLAPRPGRCWTRPSPAASPTTSPRSSRLGNTLKSWRREILAHHTTGASNGPTEGLNLCVKKVKRCGHGFRTFEHYRLRVLLHAGGITWPARPQPPRIRTRFA